MSASEPTFESTPLETLVCDTSVIINLETLGYVHLVAQLYQIVIPHRVQRELQAKREKQGYAHHDNLDTRRVDFRIFNAIDERLGEDKGATATIALASQLKSLLAVDEYRTQIFCAKRSIPYISTLTLLEYIHEERLNQRGLRDELMMLRAEGAALSDELFRGVMSRYKWLETR